MTPQRRAILQGLLNKQEPWIDREQIRKMLSDVPVDNGTKETQEKHRLKALRQAGKL